MRLAETVRFPVASFVALSLSATAGLLVPASVASITPPNADVMSSETILQRVTVRAQHTAWPEHSVWWGTYVCGQGETGMTLTLDIEPDGTARARYDFSAIESNPRVPTGAFLLVGTVRRDGRGFAGMLDATQWIVHPENYLMKALAIRSPDGRRLIGKTQHESCMEFEITRVE